MGERSNNGRIVKFRALLRLMLGTLPGWRWKLPSTLVLGFADIAVLILIPLAGARIINSLVAGSWTDFRQNLVLLGLLTFAQMGVTLAHRYVLLRIEEQSGNALRHSLVQAILQKSLQFFDKRWVGDIVSRVVNDSSLLKSFITGILLQIIYDTVSLTVVVVILIGMNPTLALLTVATVPFTLIYGRKVTPRLEAASLRVRENIAAVTSHLQSWLSKPFALKAYSIEPEVARRFKIRNDELTKGAVYVGLLSAKINALNVVLLGIPSLLIFGYGGYITLNGDLSIGALFAFVTYSAYFNGPIQRLLSNINITLPTLYPVHQRIQQFMSLEDSESAGPRPSRLARVAQLSITGLDFAFEEKGFELSVPSFVARRGEVVGIVGPNGSGKSTLARLLAGLYQPRTGVIKLDLEEDGHPRTGDKRQPAEALQKRHLLGFLPQQVTVFDGTLLENITLFDPSPDMRRLTGIQEKLGMTEWINSLQHGLKTENNGGLALKFSGGQLQKIGLSRVLYLDPPILLLDEPVTGMDRHAQWLTEQLIEQAKAEHIVIIITHSAETIASCDRVYELKPSPGTGRSFECIEMNAQEEATTVGVGEADGHLLYADR
jgi:ABC-type bacteriocin/lantibiotic exporter with double-glycine peptidase domain